MAYRSEFDFEIHCSRPLTRNSSFRIQNDIKFVKEVKTTYGFHIWIGSIFKVDLTVNEEFFEFGVHLPRT